MAGAGELEAVGSEGDIGDIARMGVQVTEHLVVAHAPDVDQVVVAPRGDNRAVRAVVNSLHGVMLCLNSVELLARRDVPEAQGAVRTSAGETAVIRAEGQIVHIPFMAQQGDPVTGRGGGKRPDLAAHGVVMPVIGNDFPVVGLVTGQLTGVVTRGGQVRGNERRLFAGAEVDIVADRVTVRVLAFPHQLYAGGRGQCAVRWGGVLGTGGGHVARGFAHDHFRAVGGGGDAVADSDHDPVGAVRFGGLPGGGGFCHDGRKAAKTGGPEVGQGIALRVRGAAGQRGRAARVHGHGGGGHGVDHRSVVLRPGGIVIVVVVIIVPAATHHEH